MIEKMKDVKLQTIAISNACAYASGNMKVDNFNKFLDSFDAKKKPVNFDKLKQMGYDIEEK